MSNMSERRAGYKALFSFLIGFSAAFVWRNIDVGILAFSIASLYIFVELEKS